jgi:uncharacterized protein (TIGR02466 family)
MHMYYYLLRQQFDGCSITRLVYGDISIFAYQWSINPFLTMQLKEMILTKESVSKSVHKSNVGGWHSDNTFFHCYEPCVSNLRQRLICALDFATHTMDQENQPVDLIWNIFGWANVSRNYHYHVEHNHGCNLWSGVYYIYIDGELSPANRGTLHLMLPNQQSKMNFLLSNTEDVMEHSVVPYENLLVLFPGHINHRVDPYFGTGVRISVAFNAHCATNVM